jgi:Cu-processing system ATP-binding protein
VVISSHILAEIEQRADRVAILSQGRLVAVGSVFDLRQRAALPARLWLQGRDASSLAELIGSAERVGAVLLERTGGGVWFSWPNGKKDQALAWLLDNRTLWVDWAWREATLEEVFFTLALEGQRELAGEEAA